MKFTCARVESKSNVTEYIVLFIGADIHIPKFAQSQLHVYIVHKLFLGLTC